MMVMNVPTTYAMNSPVIAVRNSILRHVTMAMHARRMTDAWKESAPELKRYAMTATPALQTVATVDVSMCHYKKDNAMMASNALLAIHVKMVSASQILPNVSVSPAFHRWLIKSWLSNLERVQR